jgi:hypothetical protein
MRGGSAARFGTAQDNAGQCVGGGHAALSGHALLTADKHQQQQHAAAFCSMPQRQILGAVGGGFEACRSMPQRAKIFTWWIFFFITCQTSEPFVAQFS